MTTNPIAVLDVDDARELLRAIGAGRDWSFSHEQYRQLRALSPEGFRIIGQLQIAVREAQARGEGETG